MSTPQVWYKQFWPWFLIILPLCAVAASINLLFLSIDNQDYLVSDDYYKDGKSINLDLRKEKQAQNLGLYYSLRVNEGVLELKQEGGEPYLAALSVGFFHPTLPEKDFSQIVTPDGNGIYRIELTKEQLGPWQVRIEGYDQSWRVQKRLTLVDGSTHWLN